MSSAASLPVWGGVECTRVRIGNRVCDQLVLTGHAQREGDVQRLASLGIEAVRYPVLWDRVAPRGVADADWRWSDRRLARLREAGIRPVVGLLHHGAGVEGATYLDADFAPRFAEFAHAVARRYPWVDTWLPINEPLTTARFCALYGIWWPHRRDRETFVRVLLNELLAIRAAADAIRAEIPTARILANEDVGRTDGTSRLAAQVAHDNARRWLTFDLLTGSVDERHQLWTYLATGPDAERGLRELAERPCAPDLLGVDVYATSERWLDHRLRHYPESAWGGDGERQYADVELVRVVGRRFGGIAAAIRETWRRYGVPIVLAEVHLGGSPADQVAWWTEAVAAATRARERGVAVQAITSWAAFGLMDWTSLLCEQRGEYEPGAWDVRSTPPVLTPLGEAVRATALGRRATATRRGWWRRPDRATLGPIEKPRRTSSASRCAGPPRTGRTAARSDRKGS